MGIVVHRLLAPGSWLLAPGSWLWPPVSWLLALGSWFLLVYVEAEVEANIR